MSAAAPDWVAIVAVASSGVIGRAGSLPWHLPDDLRRFKALTMGHAVLMGRRTCESIGRPLPGRENLVLTRDGDWQAAGCRRVASLEEAAAQAGAGRTVFVIGGAEVYRACWPRVGRIEMTEVHADIEGEVRLEGFDPALWREVRRERHAADPRHAHDFSFVTLLRR